MGVLLFRKFLEQGLEDITGLCAPMFGVLFLQCWLEGKSDEGSQALSNPYPEVHENRTSKGSSERIPPKRKPLFASRPICTGLWSCFEAKPKSTVFNTCGINGRPVGKPVHQTDICLLLPI